MLRCSRQYRIRKSFVKTPTRPLRGKVRFKNTFFGGPQESLRGGEGGGGGGAPRIRSKWPIPVPVMICKEFAGRTWPMIFH